MTFTNPGAGFNSLEFSSTANWRWHTRQEPPHSNENDNLTKKHWFHSLPFQQFQALLTLFSKSFSPFPHGTCLLSVSNQYLALDEIYHPLCAPIPRNVTLRRYTVHGGLQMTNGTLTLIDALFQEAYICASAGNAISRLQFKARGPNFHAELIPVHSPLLRESYLVSYPPLTYMLKFSGFADLTSCLGGKARMAIEIKALPASKTTEMASETLTELLVAESPCMLNASGVCAKRSTRHLDTQIRNSCIHAPKGRCRWQ